MRGGSVWVALIGAAHMAAATMMTGGRPPPPPPRRPTEFVYGDDGPDPPAMTADGVASLAYHGCSDREIADRFDADEAEVRRRFRRVLRVNRGIRAYKLRRAQTDLAVGDKPAAAMLTWLGRNELGQGLSAAEPGTDVPDLPEKVG